MNDKYYIDKLTYKIGEIVWYMGGKHEITHIRDDGLINLKAGWFFYYGCHPNMFYKVENEQ